MVIKRLGIIGFISAAAIVSGVIVGCGGSSSLPTSTVPPVITTGGIATGPGSSPNAVGQSSSPQQVQVTQNGNTVTPAPFLPAGETLTAGENVTVIPMGVPFLNNTVAPKVNSKKPQSGTDPLLISYTGPGGPYFQTGVNINPDTSLDGNLVLGNSSSFTNGEAWLLANGPFSISNSAGTATLTCGTMYFGVVTLADGNSSIPVANGLTLKIPANGGNTANGNFVSVAYPTPDFSTGTGLLQIVWPGETKTQTRAVTSGTVSFSDPLSDPTDGVPLGGITSISYNYQPLATPKQSVK